MRKGIQLIIFGQGEAKYTDYFRECADRYSGQLGFSDNYSEDMAAKIFAGADLYLMPSEFEPCGLSQMMAMRYGTVPVVHETGGLKDTVRPYSDFDGIGDGFSFSEYSVKAFMLAIDAAIRVYFAERQVFEEIKDRCMKKDFSWDRSALAYIKMYSDIRSSGQDPNVTFQDAYDALKVVYEDLEKSRDTFLKEQSDDYSIIAQIRIEGPGEGTFHIKINKNGLEMHPYSYDDADVKIATTLDNLFNMATGTVSADKLFVNGQMKVEGNISKGAQLRYLIGKDEEE
ncbi:MAG: SCP2 sterol-binding domain-containing protein [Erysipelotrichaceae bacterium]|nr:SCP2 sterol-binding domain-containing protein [Erysipelotrichaceae bacterium]